MNALTRQEIAQLDAPVVRFELNGREIEAPANLTLIEIADAEGLSIPRLCYKAGLDKVGNCRSCMVEIAGERVLAPSCCRTPTEGMKVTTASERVRTSQKLVLELLADLSTVMRDASICGLGQAAPNPVDCVVKYFPHELEKA